MVVVVVVVAVVVVVVVVVGVVVDGIYQNRLRGFNFHSKLLERVEATRHAVLFVDAAYICPPEHRVIGCEAAGLHAVESDALGRDDVERVFKVGPSLVSCTKHAWSKNPK